MSREELIAILVAESYHCVDCLDEGYSEWAQRVADRIIDEGATS